MAEQVTIPAGLTTRALTDYYGRAKWDTFDAAAKQRARSSMNAILRTAAERKGMAGLRDKLGVYQVDLTRPTVVLHLKRVQDQLDAQANIEPPDALLDWEQEVIADTPVFPTVTVPPEDITANAAVIRSMMPPSTNQEAPVPVKEMPKNLAEFQFQVFDRSKMVSIILRRAMTPEQVLVMTKLGLDFLAERDWVSRPDELIKVDATAQEVRKPSSFKCNRGVLHEQSDQYFSLRMRDCMDEQITENRFDRYARKLPSTEWARQHKHLLVWNALDGYWLITNPLINERGNADL